MLISKQMGVRGVVCFFAIFLLLITATKAAPEVKKRTRQLLWNDQNDSRKINDDTADLLWRRHCRLALFHAMEVVEDLHMQGQEFGRSYEIIPESDPFSKENIHQIVNSLHPLVKQTVVDCLRKSNLAVPVNGEDIDSQKWYTKYLKLFYVRPQIPRRRSLDQSSAEAPAPSPSFSPQPSPAPAPAITGTKNPQPARPPTKPFFLPDLNNPTSQTSDTTNLNPTTGVPSNDPKSNRKTVVIAVVVTAAVTFLVSALMFLCYRRFCGPGSRAGQNDERPLLSLSLSDYSHGNSINVKPGDQSLYAHSDSNKMAASVNGKFSFESDKQITSNIDPRLATDGAIAKYSIEDSAKVLPSQLKLPPGRLGPSGQPPLKPPPGRTDHLEPPRPGKGPPVPPAPPPGKGPPSPAVQPPSMKTLGSPRPPPPGAPPPPPIPSGNKSGPRPPPPPSSSVPPPRPPAFGLKPPVPSPPSTKAASEEVGADVPRAKLKPFFWDKVLANPDHSMVWHQIKSGSFQFNEEMIETLFGYAPPVKNKNDQKKESSSHDAATQYIQIIDPKKSQNLSILLKALNVTTEEVRDAIEEGNELSPELLQTLLKMAPTTDEELKLRLYSGELSRLGPADRFLKILVDIPFAFKRLESLLFMSTLQEEVSMIKESFATLEAACTELRKSRLFLKLLEAVLKTGNRMNDGTFRGGAQAFKLDTLLKLSDVKGVDGKTTLLHFVVQEIIRSEGKRAERTAKESQSMPNITSDDVLEDSSQDLEEHYCSLGLQVVSSLDDELGNVKKAAIIDADNLTGNVAKLGHALVKSRDFLKSDMKNLDEENRFHQTLKSFVQNAEVDVMWLLEEEKRIMALVKSTEDYFHGNSTKDEGLRLFVIVRDFLILLGKTCKEVKDAPRKPNRMLKKEDSTVKSSSAPRQFPSPDPRQRLFPAITERRIGSSSSDDEAS